MDNKLRALYQKYSVSMAYIAVEHSNGDEGIGSAFHVGDGVFITARHVVEGNKILEIATATNTYIPLEGDAAEKSSLTVRSGDVEFKAHPIMPSKLEIITGPLYHQNDEIDIAAFKVSGLDPYTPAIPLGDHLDDWLGLDDFVLTDVLILGFPPIPFARKPTLIATKGEVSALMDLRHARHVHFIVSAMPRGGFSGGVVITSDGISLGVITQSLVMNSMPEQLGYMAVLSVEPIYECLAQNKLLPAAQDEVWGGFWNEKTSWYAKAGYSGRHERLSITTLDDGRNLLFSVYSTVELDRQKIVSLIETIEGLTILRKEIENDTLKFYFVLSGQAERALEQLSESAMIVIAEMGYIDQNDYLIANSKDVPF